MTVPSHPQTEKRATRILGPRCVPPALSEANTFLLCSFRVLEKDLIERGLKFFHSTTCVDFDKFGEIFTVDLKTPKGTTETFYSQQVAFATGKASGLFLRKMLTGLNVELEFNSIELGVRVETS